MKPPSNSATTTTSTAIPVELLTPSQLAKEINTTPQTIGNWHRAGVIPARIAVGRIIRFDRGEVLAALATQSRKAEVKS